MRFLSGPQKQSVLYKNFKGVDFSQDAILCSREHSPYALNMISDKNGLPEKRVGTRTLHRLKAPINGIFYGDINGKRVYIVHANDTLYRFCDTTVTQIYTGVDNKKSSAFFMFHENKSKLFLLTSGHFLCYDGETVKNVSDIAYVPTIVIGKEPQGGGTALEAVNLLTPKRIEKFAGNGSAKVYQLVSKDIDGASLICTQVTGSGNVKLNENADFSVNRATGQVTFVNAPPTSPITGEDNIYIQYEKTVQGYSERVTGCQICAYYGLGGSNRVFITGNESYKSYDRWCDINNPTYFPDLNYSIVGSDNTRIMGYAKIGEYLVIIKEDNNQDSTIFVRSGQLSEGKAVFPLKQGVTGIGAISPFSFVNLIDEPLFLSRTGVYAVTSNTVTAERTLQNRSFMVDSKLCKEENLENAVACEWNGYYLLSVNDKVYLFDSRRKSQTPSGGFCYESYLWDNINASCFLSCEGALYFGTADGRLCKFNTDIKTADRYNDDEKAINAFWETSADSGPQTSRFKTLSRRGGYLTVKPSVVTGCDIYLSKDGEPYEFVMGSVFALFTWENIDFSIFTFFTTETPKQILIKKSLKRYTTLQFKIANARKNQSMGIYEFGYDYINGVLKK